MNLFAVAWSKIKNGKPLYNEAIETANLDNMMSTHVSLIIIVQAFQYKLHMPNSFFLINCFFFYRHSDYLNYSNSTPTNWYDGITVKEWNTFIKGKKFIYYDVSCVDYN